MIDLAKDVSTRNRKRCFLLLNWLPVKIKNSSGMTVVRVVPLPAVGIPQKV
jgi:hypothetical protein